MQMHIQRCICVDKEDINHLPPGEDGMPALIPYLAMKDQVYWAIHCPRCGRGSVIADYKSAKAALKDWNEMQRRLKEEEYLFDVRS